jgi:hypothetical protein
MYDAAIPLVVQMLKNLDFFLDQGQAHADERKFKSELLVQSRLAPDMFNLARQVQIASDNGKACAARLAGIDPPKYEDTETTIDELKARIAKTLEFIQGIDRSKIDGSEGRDIKLVFPNQTMEFKGKDYLFQFLIPNLMFHVTMAYAILRHNGVVLTKQNFLGGK